MGLSNHFLECNQWQNFIHCKILILHSLSPGCLLYCINLSSDFCVSLMTVTRHGAPQVSVLLPWQTGVTQCGLRQWTGSAIGLSLGQRQTITWTNDDLLSVATLGRNLSQIWNQIQKFSFKKLHLKMLSAKCQPFCFSLNVLRLYIDYHNYWLVTVTIANNEFHDKFSQMRLSFIVKSSLIHFLDILFFKTTIFSLLWHMLRNILVCLPVDFCVFCPIMQWCPWCYMPDGILFQHQDIFATRAIMRFCWGRSSLLDLKKDKNKNH